MLLNLIGFKAGPLSFERWNMQNIQANVNLKKNRISKVELV